MACFGLGSAVLSVMDIIGKGPWICGISFLLHLYVYEYVFIVKYFLFNTFKICVRYKM